MDSFFFVFCYYSNLYHVIFLKLSRNILLISYMKKSCFISLFNSNIIKYFLLGIFNTYIIKIKNIKKIN